MKKLVISIIAFLKEPKSLNLSFNASKLSLTYKNPATIAPNATTTKPVDVKRAANAVESVPIANINGPIADTNKVMFKALFLNSGLNLLTN